MRFRRSGQINSRNPADFFAVVWLYIQHRKEDQYAEDRERGCKMDQERVVLVTGVSSGIGKETAALLLKQQFRTFGTVRDTGHIADAPKGLELVRLDVRDDVSVKSGVQTLLDRAGRIDALV